MFDERHPAVFGVPPQHRAEREQGDQNGEVGFAPAESKPHVFRNDEPGGDAEQEKHRGIFAEQQ